MSPAELEVEVVYALPLEQDVTALRVPAGTTVAQAIERSGVAVRHPETRAVQIRAAIYGRRVTGETVLRDRDRVELLRPLIADPKEARRQRASARRRPAVRG